MGRWSNFSNSGNTDTITSEFIDEHDHSDGNIGYIDNASEYIGCSQSGQRKIAPETQSIAAEEAS